MSDENKPPAFQFYAADFILGTVTLSLANRGAYITLLSSQWDRGYVPDDAVERQRILGCTAKEESAAWRALRSKFVQGTDAQWRNARLEAERRKQSAYRLEQSARGKSGALKRWGT